MTSREYHQTTYAPPIPPERRDNIQPVPPARADVPRNPQKESLLPQPPRRMDISEPETSTTPHRVIKRINDEQHSLSLFLFGTKSTEVE